MKYFIPKLLSTLKIVMIYQLQIAAIEYQVTTNLPSFVQCTVLGSVVAQTYLILVAKVLMECIQISKLHLAVYFRV
jgi:hypothetical protein